MSQIVLQAHDGKTVTVDTGLFIDNQFVAAKDHSTLDLENPTSGKSLGHVAAAQREDVDIAVESSLAAFRGPWSRTTPAQRGRLLGRLADLIERDGEELAIIEAVDAGILFGESKGLHVTQAVETLRHFAGWSDKMAGQLFQTSLGVAYTRIEPIGVCAAVIPWNAPLMITIWKLAPAIAAGNVLIVKTPEAAPLYGQKLASLTHEAGFPPGVINVLCGDGKVAGQALAEHVDVKKISFTGSPGVGRQIMRTAANTNLKKVSLELGGKGPSIVFDDADMENALFWTSLGITANNGQVCMAGSRIYVHEKIYEEFLSKFSEKCTQGKHGDPLDPSTTKGPLINKTQYEKVLGFIEKAKSDGLRILHGGAAIGESGYFIANTAFADVPDDHTIMNEEIFGPVAAIQKFSTEEEVVQKANNTRYGLGAAVFTNDVSRSHRMSEAIESGQVMINCWGALDANVPFGGVKESGFGRELGQACLNDWTLVKSVKFHILPSAKL